MSRIQTWHGMRRTDGSFRTWVSAAKRSKWPLKAGEPLSSASHTAGSSKGEPHLMANQAPDQHDIDAVRNGHLACRGVRAVHSSIARRAVAQAAEAVAVP